MEELDHEKFEGVKELAEISTQISASTALLASYKETEAEYLAEREEKLVNRLKQALVDSSDLITAIGSNHSELVGYRNDLVSFHESILSLLQGVMECKRLVEDAANELDAQMSRHETNLTNFAQDSARERALIHGAKGELQADRDQLTKDQRIVADQRDTLDRAFARLNDKR